jgi:hypothetical protein
MKFIQRYVASALVLIVVVALALEINHQSDYFSEAQSSASPEGRAEFELNRLADPATGEIPFNIRAREMAFSRTLPAYGASREAEMVLNFTNIGPYNVGGRTRGFAIDITNNNLYLAGGVTGGMWKSVDAGQNWKRVTSLSDHPGVSCVAQDTRSGKTNIWYCGSGEVDGVSASKSYSAFYYGSGIYKSTDKGETWTHLESTSTLVNKASDWEAVFRVLVDPTRFDSNIVFAATKKGIMRSNDGGLTWKQSLKANNASYTDLSVTTSGVCFAAISSDGGGNVRGFWRSTDGVNWVNITASNFPSNHTRTLLAVYPSDENRVYFMSLTPGSGTLDISLWKYKYLSGDGTGAGGEWENRSDGLPHQAMSLQGGYSQALGVKPDDDNVVFVGGTNLYRSDNGFADTNETHHIGGYKIEWDESFDYRSGIHYPDQQALVFDPFDPDVLISTTDGGIHRTTDCGGLGFDWESLSNGYVVSLFYGICIDHATSGSEEVMGGLQDRGTFWTNSSNPTKPWVSVRGSDGAYVWIEDGGGHHYSSTQYANVRRAAIDANGNLGDWKRVIPESFGSGGGNGWLFVHPFTLDPVDNDIMYLPKGNQIWRNNYLPGADVDDLSHWAQLGTIGGTVTAIAASENPQGVVYAGSSNTIIYKLTDAHSQSTVPPELISSGITNGKYTSCIAIDPNDADRVVVVYSNYNVISLWYTEDGGENWTPIEGNLKGETDANVPPMLYYIGNGPSMRWFEFAETDEGYVYFLGTSIGLFSTRELKGDSTVWTQEGAETIGNVVVDMLDYRREDQWLVVGTHGNGIFTANVEFNNIPDTIDTANSVANIKPTLGFAVYPNPAISQVTLKVPSSVGGSNKIQLVDQQGRKLKSLSTSKSTYTMGLDGVADGLYFIVIEGNGERRTQSLVVNRP